MNDAVFHAATQILAASNTGARGDGLHESPELVARSVRIAKLLIVALDEDAKSDDDERKALVAEVAKLNALLKKERGDHGNTQSTLDEVRAQLAAALPPAVTVPAPVVGDAAIAAALEKAKSAGSKPPAPPAK